VKVCERLLKEYLPDHALVSLLGDWNEKWKTWNAAGIDRLQIALKGNVKLLLCHSLCSFFCLIILNDSLFNL